MPALNFPDSPSPGATYAVGTRTWTWTTSYATTTSRTNLIQNPNFEVGTSTWTIQGGATIARSTAHQYFGAASLLITSSTTDYNGASIGTNRATVTAGQTYYLSAYVRNISGSTRFIYIGIQWYNSSGVFISEVNSFSQGSLSTAAGWVRRYATGTAPANAVSANIFILSGSTGLTAGWETAADGILLETGSTQLPYFDGAYADAYSGYTLTSQSWSGTANASTSTATWGLNSSLNSLWTVNAGALSTGVVGSNELAAGAVTTTKIGTNAITASTLASSPTNNYILTADSATATGTKWATPQASGGLTTSTEGAITTMAIGA
jgi:hypothetical protein